MRNQEIEIEWFEPVLPSGHCQPRAAELQRFDLSIHLPLLQGDPAESTKSLFVQSNLVLSLPS